MGLRPLLSLSMLLAAGVVGSAEGGSTSCASCAPPPPCNCAPTSHQVKVPGVSITTPQINIGLPSIGFGAGAGGASASGAGSASAEAGSSSNVSVSVSTSGSTNSSSQNTAGLLGSFGGGGSGSWTPEGGVTTEIGEVKVEQIGLPPPPIAPVCLAWKAMTRQIAVQAMCLDDKSVPHPASQVSPERLLAGGYEGEVFRCIAGAKMQYTIADFSGQADFTHGQTIACNKGEALYHAANGALQCRPQTPARDCNERSLLRRFGAGIKVMAMSGERQCVQWGQQTVAVAPTSRGPMVLN